jgi:tetratricopeptide (TPR) repeat protein
MIVAVVTAKNERDQIGACLIAASAVADSLLVIDTGSNDGTQGEARSHGAQVTEADWPNDWAATYNRAIDAGFDAGASVVWILDADEVYQGGAIPETDAPLQYHCRLYRGGWEVWMPRIVRSREVRFSGKRHATARGYRAEKSTVEVVETRKPGCASHDPGRFNRDVQHFRELLKRNPGDTRSAYYLAQSLKDARRYDEARTAFVERAYMDGGFAEERYLAWFFAGDLEEAAGDYDFAEASYRSAVKCRPSRAEARCRLAALVARRDTQEALKLLPEPDAATDDLFLVHRPSYREIPDKLRAIWNP